jgi:hypothetical protein
MNIAAPDPPTPVGCVQAVALGEEVFQRPWRRAIHWAGRAIASDKRGRRRTAMPPVTRIGHHVALACAAHLGTIVVQMKKIARHLHRNRVGRIEAKEPDARLTPDRHVCSHIELRKRRYSRQQREQARPNPGHPKRHDPDPGRAIEGVDRQGGWDGCADRRDRDRPVHKQQVVPLHVEHPRQARQRPGAMGGISRHIAILNYSPRRSSSAT